MSHDATRATVGSQVGTGATAWFEQVRAFGTRYARELFRNRMALFWTLGFPVGFYLLTITVFVDTGSIPASATPYVKAGTAVSYGMFGAIVASLNSFGQQLAADFEADRYEQFRALPVSPSADLAGRMLAGFALSFVALAAVLVVAVPTGAEFGLRSAASPVVVALGVLTFAAVWMVAAVLVSTAVRDTRYASVITISVALVSYFLTGYNGTDPASFQGPDAVLNYLPNTLAARLVGHHLVVPPNGGSALAPPAVPGVAAGLGLLGLYAAVALAVGVLVVRRVVYRTGVSA